MTRENTYITKAGAFLRTGLALLLTLGSLGLGGCVDNSQGNNGTPGDGDNVNDFRPAAPTVTVSTNVKQITFSWPEVTGASYYRLMQDANGASGYTQVGANIPATTPTPTNATPPLSKTLDVATFRVDWANVRFAVEACNTWGCRASFSSTVANSPQWTMGYIKNASASLGEGFGQAVAISGDGNTMAIAAVNKTKPAGVGGVPAAIPNVGLVYIFRRTNLGWLEQGWVAATNAVTGDQFGYSLALSDDGNTLAVGAIGESESVAGPAAFPPAAGGVLAARAGAVYIFTYGSAAVPLGWAQTFYIKAPVVTAGEEFGTSVALSGNGLELAVGTPKGVGVAATNSGAVYTYAYTAGATPGAGTWAADATIVASNGEANDLFGNSVALSDDGATLAIGATGEASAATGINGNQADNTAAGAGAVYLFTKAAAVWTQQAYVKGSVTAAGNAFGQAIALDSLGNTLAVGASGEGLGTGAAYLFTRNATSNTWSQQARIQASNKKAGDQFGGSVALSGNATTLAVGAKFEDGRSKFVDGYQLDNATNPANTDAGAVYVFSGASPSWSQIAYVKATNTDPNDQFGWGVALDTSGNSLVVSAINEAGIKGLPADNTMAGAGAAYLY